MEECPACCQACATCLLCLYSCRWSPDVRGPPALQCDRSWWLLLLAVCLFTLVWLYFAFVLLNDFHNFNEWFFRQTQSWVDWSPILLAASALLLTYSALLLVLALCLQLCGQPLKLHWLHKVTQTRGPVIAGICLQAMGPFLHIGAVAGMTLLAWPVASTFYCSSNTGLRVLLLLGYFGTMAALYLAPLAITSPCLLEESQLPPKPDLFGHRGAPMLAPENTLMSLNKSAQCGVRVFETDVMVSADGVPFLMHDAKLTRTTNVQDKFPDRAAMNATTFNWTELQQLDAGSWFLEVGCPREAAWPLSGEDQRLVEHQKIPSLQQVLGEARQHNLSIMFDLRPENHSDYQHFINATVETILRSGIPPQMILWLPEEFREQVERQAPGFRQIYCRKKLQNETVPLRRVNLPYQDLSMEEIRLYRRDNISVNLYVVNRPWLFSVLWCAGVGSVTTNACQVLKEMNRPLWLLPSNTYLMIWIVVDCVSILLILWAFVLLQ
uniref:Glycerophosphodiester phosphodiesterase domain containing 2 n=1 Tax=Crocodylus porosus TaxID=8502 RepID=A0A7M4EDY3_CROPO